MTTPGASICVTNPLSVRVVSRLFKFEIERLIYTMNSTSTITIDTQIGDPALPEALLDSGARIARAYECMNDLNRSLRSYIESNSANIISEPEPDANGNIRRMVQIKPPERRLRILIGDIANHAYSALDYIVWGLIPKSERINWSPLGARTCINSIGWPCPRNLTTDPALDNHVRTKLASHKNWIESEAFNIICNDLPMAMDSSNCHPLHWMKIIRDPYEHHAPTVVRACIQGHDSVSATECTACMNFGTFDDDVVLENTCWRGSSNEDNDFDGTVCVSIQHVELSCFPDVATGGTNTTLVTATLEDIVGWVRDRWGDFQQRPDLFANADAR